ncbi:MAG: HIRAN domain-containing protein [Sporolactobacillus sp.]
MLNTNLLWLIWQNNETRQRYHVGNLLYNEKKRTYLFWYDQSGKHRGLADALKDGYNPHLSFPNLDKCYLSHTLFSPFQRRLPDAGRPDFLSLLKKFGLTKDYTEMDMLYVTGGRLATDSYEFVQPIIVQNNLMTINFYIAGIRHYNAQDEPMNLTFGKSLRLIREPSNNYDPFAVRIETEDNHLIGYVPAFYSEFVSKLLQYKVNNKLKLLEIDEHAIPQLRIRASLIAEFVDKKVSPLAKIEPTLNLSPLLV